MSIGTIKVIWSTFRNYRGHLAGLVVLGFLGALLEGVGVGAAMSLLSFLLNPGSLPATPLTEAIEWLFSAAGVRFSFRFLLIFIVGLFLLRAASLALFGFIRGWISADFLYRESYDSLQRLLRASWPYLLRQKLGEMHTTLVRDLQRTGALLWSVGQALQSFTGFLIYLIVAINISPIMVLYTLVGGAVLLGLVRPFLLRTQSAGKAMAGKEKEVSQFITEHVLGMKPLKAAAAEGRALARAETLLAALRKIHIRLGLIVPLSTAMFQPFTIVFIIILFAIMYQTPGFNLISFGATLYLIQKIFAYLETGQSALHAISETVPYAASFEGFKRDLRTHEEPHNKGGKPFMFEREIRFDKVALAYVAGERVLADVNFTAKKGDTVAFIGPSGAGKTSVADLLLRLFDATAGEISVDGVPAREISLGEWRSHFGYVAQDPFLFNGSIEENIRMYRPELSRQDIERAAKEANIYDHIMSLPDGFATMVGDRGVMLSGGQRQRVALARVLAGRPQILVLDEATSALDQDSERLIQEALASLHGRVTVFIIAHRLSTLESADWIVVLDRGTIIEQGSPADLRKNPESYFTKRS